MNLKDFIAETEAPKTNEAEHKKVVTELKFLEILKEQARNSYKVVKRSPIFVKDTGSPFYVVDPAVKELKSSFWIDRLTWTLNNWGRYPSRKKCLKGYTSLGRIDAPDEEIYVLIPLDKARVGICSSGSFYKSFKVAQKDLGIDRMDNERMANWVDNIAKGVSELNEKHKIKKPETYAEFTRAVVHISEALKGKIEKLKRKLKDNEHISDEVRSVMSDLLNRHVTNVHDYLAEKLDPEDNGFDATRIESFNKLPDEREVWIAEKCLLVQRSKYLEMFKRGAVN